MDTVTVYNTDSVKARDILAKVSYDDVLTENIECTGKVYVEQCFFDAKRRFDQGLFDVEMRIIGTVKELFIEDYDNTQFPCGTKKITFTDAEPVMINYQLTAEEQGILFTKGVNHPGFEPPANMKYNIMEIPMYIEYKGIYESPICFARIIRPNEIQTSTKKCGYYGLFDLTADHPDVIRERENNGIDINLAKSSPELRMEAPVKQISDSSRTMIANKILREKEAANVPAEDKSVAAVRSAIEDRMSVRSGKSGMQKASDTTVQIYHESVEEYTKDSDVTDHTNISDIGADERPLSADNVLPYTVRQMDSGLYSVLSQKVEEHVENASKNNRLKETKTGEGQFTENDQEQTKSLEDTSAGLGEEDKSMSKAEREEKRQMNIVRQMDIAADNKALNADANADIAGYGASLPKKSTAQELLGDIMDNQQKPSSSEKQLSSSEQQFL